MLCMYCILYTSYMCIPPGEKLAKFQIQNGFADALDPFNTIWNFGKLHWNIGALYKFKLNLPCRQVKHGKTPSLVGLFVA